MEQHRELEQVATEARETAEELMERGEALLSRGRALLALVMDIDAVTSGLAGSQSGITEQRSVGRTGAVEIGRAIQVTRELGTFTRKEFQDATGLNDAQGMKWISLLVHNKPQPIIRDIGASDRPGRPKLYEYIPVEGQGPTERPEHARQVEAQAGVGIDRSESGVVAYTGRVKGSSGKPGLDKRLSRTRRIKRSKGNIMGGKK